MSDEVRVTVTIEQDGDEIAELREKLADAYIQLSGRNAHHSDCATSAAPAETPGPCDCTEPAQSPSGILGGGPQPVPASAAVVARRVDELEHRLRTMQARIEHLERQLLLVANTPRGRDPAQDIRPWNAPGWPF